MIELWKKHPKYRLEVSNFGNIRGARSIRKPRVDKHGYERINITVCAKSVTLKVHTLVCDVWVGDSSSQTVNHKDGNKRNNRASNLEIVSASENTSHAFRAGLVGTCKPVLGFFSKREASRQLGVCRTKL